MNTVTAESVIYPTPPKGWKGSGFYFERKEIGQFTTDLDTVEEIESEARRRFPNANWIRVTDAAHPCGWMAGTL
jgi:hypothetical protein